MDNNKDLTVGSTGCVNSDNSNNSDNSDNSTNSNNSNNSNNNDRMDEQLEQNFIEALQEYSETVLETNQNTKKSYAGVEIIIANLPKVYELLVEGETITNICKQLGISRKTWYNTLKNNKHFQNMIKMAQEEQVANVRKSLVAKCGDRYVTREKVLPNGAKVMFEDFLPADMQAVKFYLLNKAGEEFKEKQEVTIRKTNIVVDIVDCDYDVE